MPIERFNTDQIEDRTRLRHRRPSTNVQVLPRTTVYGTDGARADGLQPLGEVPDVLIPEDRLREALKHAHDQQTLPQYWQRYTWGPPGFRWSQNGLNFCWSWGGVAALLDVRAVERKPTIMLAPISMGFLVNWRNRGNTLGSFIRGARKQGIAPAKCIPDSAWYTLNPDAFDSCWSTERSNYRLDQVWDCNPARMIQHCASILVYGRPIYTAYMWWGHALELVAMYYEDDGTLVFVLRNSHNENDLIELTGSHAAPDEAYGFINTKTV